MELGQHLCEDMSRGCGTTTASLLCSDLTGHPRVPCVSPMGPELAFCCRLQAAVAPVHHIHISGAYGQMSHPQAWAQLLSRTACGRMVSPVSAAKHAVG